jgi:hypothetical protein
LTLVKSEPTTGIKRILPRYEFEARVKIEVLRGAKKFSTEGWARNLSESGMRAFVGAELFIGELATLGIPLRAGLELVVPAEITRSLGTEYGFQFTALSPRQRDQIRSILAVSKVIPYSPAD